MSKENPISETERKYDGLVIGALKLLPSGVVVLELANKDKHIFTSKARVFVKRDFSKMRIIIEADEVA